MDFAWIRFHNRNIAEYFQSIDFFLILDVFFAVTALAMFQSLRYVKPIHTKFELDDKKHAKPFLPLVMKNKTLTFWTLIFPVVIVVFMESMFPRRQGMSHAANFVWRFCLTGVLCQIIKLVVSSPRPNAIHLEDKRFNVLCDNSNFESRQSFFSGHAAAGLCSALFVRSYLENKFPDLKENPVFSLLVNSLPALGLYPGYTQWKQNWHHLHDVVFGYLYGYLAHRILFVWTYHWHSETTASSK
jgi:hypothetical protein